MLFEAQAAPAPRNHPVAVAWTKAQLLRLDRNPSRTAAEKERAERRRQHILSVGERSGRDAARREDIGDDPADVLRELNDRLDGAGVNIEEKGDLTSHLPEVEATARRVARRLARGGHGEAEEVTASSLAKIVQAIHRQRAPQDLAVPWVVTVTRTAHIDQRRTVIRVDRDIAAAESVAWHLEAGDDEETPAVAIKRSALRAFLRQLAPHPEDDEVIARWRTVARMRLADLTDEDIAQALGVTRATVRQDVKRFREWIERHDPLAADILPGRNPAKRRPRVGLAARSERELVPAS